MLSRSHLPYIEGGRKGTFTSIPGERKEKWVSFVELSISGLMNLGKKER